MELRVSYSLIITIWDHQVQVNFTYGIPDQASNYIQPTTTNHAKACVSRKREDLLHWWNSLSHQLRVEPISATSCALPHKCVAVELRTKPWTIVDLFGKTPWVHPWVHRFVPVRLVKILWPHHSAMN